MTEKAMRCIWERFMQTPENSAKTVMPTARKKFGSSQLSWKRTIPIQTSATPETAARMYPHVTEAGRLVFALLRVMGGGDADGVQYGLSGGFSSRVILGESVNSVGAYLPARRI